MQPTISPIGHLPFLVTHVLRHFLLDAPFLGIPVFKHLLLRFHDHKVIIRTRCGVRLVVLFYM
jgi:hypothetical protein